MNKDLQHIGNQVVGILSKIFDPEIPVSIYELGLIYDVKISSDYDVEILMKHMIFYLLW